MIDSVFTAHNRLVILCQSISETQARREGVIHGIGQGVAVLGVFADLHNTVEEISLRAGHDLSIRHDHRRLAEIELSGVEEGHRAGVIPLGLEVFPTNAERKRQAGMYAIPVLEEEARVGILTLPRKVRG